MTKSRLTTTNELQTPNYRDNKIQHANAAYYAIINAKFAF